MKKFLNFLPALFFYGLIFLVSSQNLGVGLPGHWLDKVPHALEFAALGYLLSLGFFRAVASSARLSVALTFLVGTALGALDEFHQKFVRGRVSDPWDAAADALGIAVGIAIYRHFLRKKKKRPAG